MKRKKLTWLVALAVLFVFSMIMVAGADAVHRHV